MLTALSDTQIQMNLLCKSFLLILFSLLIGSSNHKSSSVHEREIENFISFSKVYGYIKYFHPSDEAQEVDWDKMAIFGVDKVRNARSNEELRIVLEDFFSTVAPTVTFTENKPTQNLFYSNYLELINTDVSELKPIAWQYLGIDLSQQIQVRNT